MAGRRITSYLSIPGIALALFACSPSGDSSPEGYAEGQSAETAPVIESGQGDLAMSEKIAPRLKEAFASSRADPSHRERVIITLEKGSDPAALEAKGISVVSRMENLPIVVANIDAAGLEALAASEGVEWVEQDGTMRIPEDE